MTTTPSTPPHNLPPALHPEDEHHFTFQFTILEVSALVKHHQLVVRFGMKVNVVPLDRLRFLYRRELKDRDVTEITIAYSSQPNRRDRLKRARIYSNRGQKGMEELWSFLLWSHPETNISHYPLREAYHTMGTRDLPWLAVPSVMSLGIVLVALAGMPLLLHGLDRGEVSVTAADVYQNPMLLDQPTSHNIKILGRAELSQTARLQDGQGEYAEFKYFSPLYPASEKAPSASTIARVILQYPKKEADTLISQSTQAYQGTLRSIGWEGLGDQTRRLLESQGVLLGPSVFLIELGVTPADDLTIYLSLLGALSLITLITTLYLKPPRLG